VHTANPAGSPKITDVRITGVPEPGSTKPDEFERFEDLTRKLVQVPKTEVDEKRG
jgi:hypothetical protein